MLIHPGTRPFQPSLVHEVLVQTSNIKNTRFQHARSTILCSSDLSSFPTWSAIHCNFMSHLPTHNQESHCSHLENSEATSMTLLLWWFRGVRRDQTQLPNRSPLRRRELPLNGLLHQPFEHPHHFVSLPPRNASVLCTTSWPQCLPRQLLRRHGWWSFGKSEDRIEKLFVVNPVFLTNGSSTRACVAVAPWARGPRGARGAGGRRGRGKGGPFRPGWGLKIQILIFPFFWFLLFVFLFVSLCFLFCF